MSGQGEEVAAALERHEKLMQEKKDMGKAIGGDVKERIADQVKKEVAKKAGIAAGLGKSS